MKTTHACPGCGKGALPQHILACRSCWGRLPRELQRRITHSWRTHDLQGHVAARAEAVSFWEAG